jgi:hypothetical protein
MEGSQTTVSASVEPVKHFLLFNCLPTEMKDHGFNVERHHVQSSDAHHP